MILQYEKEKYSALFSMLGTDKEYFCQKIEKLTALPEIRMTKEEIDGYCQRWENATVKNFINTPGGFTKEDAEEIFIRRFVSGAARGRFNVKRR